MPLEAASLLHPAFSDDLPGIKAGFTTRHGGVSTAPYEALNLGLSTDDAPAQVAENRRILAVAAGFSTDRLVIAGQVHKAEVWVATGPGLFPGYDALVTNQADLLLCITAADCAAVLLADPVHRVVGACHAGWRGTVAGIVGQTIGVMKAQGARSQTLHAYISPCISAAHFEVGPEVAAQFDDAFVIYPPGQPRPYVDLKAAIAAQLVAAGVSPAAIEISPHCTFAQTTDFFSYRAEGGLTGRMMGVIGMT